jgi:NADH-quinone oxidoreductase subunit C
MTEESKETTVKPSAETAVNTETQPKEEQPDPKKEAAQKVLDRIRGLIVQELGDHVLEDALLMKHQPTFVVKRDHWLQTVQLLRHHDALGFDYPEAMAGTDYPANGYIEVILYVYSMNHNELIAVKTRTPRDNAELQSLSYVYQGLNWEEREIYDLVGVKFTGHPDLRRIMMPEDYEGHPLRKDFSVWKE